MEPQVRPVYRIGDAEVDPVGGCIRRDGKELYLRPKALAVLLHLIEHRDEVVSKRGLMAAIWGDVAVADDALVGCIVEIRKTLGDNARHASFLRTVPKIGYRLLREAAIPPTLRTGRRVWQQATIGIVAVLLALLLAGAATRIHWHGAPSRREVAWWRLDEASGNSARDSSGNGNSGRFAGEVQRTPGKMGAARRFDGVSGKVQGVAASRGLPHGNAPRTVAAWVRTASSNGDRTPVFQYGPTTLKPGGGTILGLDELARPMFQTSPWTVDLVGTSHLDDDRWHYLTAVYEGIGTGMGRLYVDGVEEGSTKLPRLLDSNEDLLWSIGAAAGNSTHFRGAIGDVRVFSRALHANEIQALYGCSSGARYLLPVFSGSVRVEPPSLIRNTGTGYAGVQFARSDGRCAVDTLRGEGVGQNLDMQMDLLVPTDAGGNVSEAGPYFRSRAAAPGDGIIGGTSAGYWVQLQSNGMVRIKRLNPHSVVAFAAARPDFDPAVFHHLEIQARGSELTVLLDRQRLTFDQAGQIVDTVAIPPAWEGPPATGHNDHTAGVAFGSELLNSRIGGQQLKNLTIDVLKP